MELLGGEARNRGACRSRYAGRQAQGLRGRRRGRVRDRGSASRRPYIFSVTLLKDSPDIQTVPERLGHRDVSTTMIHTHVLNRGPAGVRSPADRMLAP